MEASFERKASQTARLACVFMLLAACAFAYSSLSACAPAVPKVDLENVEVATVDYVIDGDTMIVNRGGGPEKMRLIGVNTPESATGSERDCAEGEEASEYVRSLVAQGQEVYLVKDTSETDKYGRLLRYCWLDAPNGSEDAGAVAAKMLNAKLVAEGWAETMSYEPDTLYADLFASLEKSAPIPYSSGRPAQQAAA